MADIVLNIDMDAPCRRCGKGGAVNGGVCMKCMLKAIQSGEVDRRLAAKRRPPTR